MFDMNWDKKRLEELEMVQDLVWKCRGLNNGSHVLEKIKDCIETAEKLTSVDLRNGSDSFIGFLRSEAIRSRAQQVTSEQGEEPKQ
jgi:hypothetical protein